MLIMPPALRAALPGAGDIFERVFRLSGEMRRNVYGRRTIRLTLGDTVYYVKTHWDIGWKEIFKNLLYLKLPVVDARTEWNALCLLQQLGIATPVPVAMGTRGWNPATRRSFLITEDIGESITLEELLNSWSESKPLVKSQVVLKRRLIQQVARLAKTLHDHGINHRDLYLCHLRIKPCDDQEGEEGVSHQIFLMDLHRAQIRRETPIRWIVKDLGALLFSCKPYPITLKDQLRFLREYTGGFLREPLRENRKIWDGVQRRANRMYGKHGAPQQEAHLLSLSLLCGLSALGRSHG
jgi:heptose I phosphotransferase